jgi:hypothetical protein
VNKATQCDWVLVAPGVYPGSVVIRTPDLHLRGLDRNRVVIDGRHRKGVNGIAVRAGDVWVENLTVRNFDRTTPNAEHGGNEVWWSEAHGWHGNYLTVYDTGLLGGYGLFAERAEGGEWDHVYAAGFDDSGLYIGACRDCEATVSHALAERNPVGCQHQLGRTPRPRRLALPQQRGRAQLELLGERPAPATALHLRREHEPERDADDHFDRAQPLHAHPRQPDRRQQQPECPLEHLQRTAGLGIGIVLLGVRAAFVD